MSNDEYDNTMQILNRKQYELCTHCMGHMHQLENNTEQMFIFVEGGAGVGKTVLGRALCETIVRYYKKQPGHPCPPMGNGPHMRAMVYMGYGSHRQWGMGNDSGKYILILAPTGMAAYHGEMKNLISCLIVILMRTNTIYTKTRLRAFA